MMRKSLASRLQPAGAVGLAVYLVVDVLLIATAAVLPDRGSWFVVMAVTALGAGALAVGVWRQRPEPQRAWWSFVLGAVLFAGINAAGAVVTIATGPLVGWAPALLAVCVYPPFILGLAWLPRPEVKVGAIVTVDALLLALAAYLVIFAAVVRPVIGSGWDAVESIAAPLLALLVIAMIIRVLFITRVPSPAVGFVLIAVGARAVGSLSVVVPAMASAGFQQVYVDRVAPTFVSNFNPLNSPVLALWLVYGVLIGAAGLHTSLGKPDTRPVGRTEPSSTRRVSLVATSVVLVILLW